METCGMSIIKYILFFFNLIFAISGIGIIAAGGVVIADVGEFSHFMEARILAPPVVLIVAGTIVFLIAFLGCYGAIKENYTLLMAFAGAMLVIFIVELAVGIAAAVFKGDFEQVLRDQLKKSMTNYSDSDQEAWDNVQMKLKCCGVDGKEDWINADIKTGTLPLGGLPSSCCENAKKAQCLQFNSDVFTHGCYERLKMKVENNAKVLIGVGIGIAFIQVAGIVLACCLAMAIKNGGDK